MQVGRIALDPTAANLFAYGEDVPTSAVDPSGFGSLWDTARSVLEDNGGSIWNIRAPMWMTELMHNGAFAIYGHFCGPGWTNGKWLSEASVKDSDIGPGHGVDSTPIDRLDTCCMHHDRCHSECASGLCGPVKTCKNGCDTTLANCSSTFMLDFGPSMTPWGEVRETMAAEAIFATMTAQPHLRTNISGWKW